MIRFTTWEGSVVILLSMDSAAIALLFEAHRAACASGQPFLQCGDDSISLLSMEPAFAVQARGAAATRLCSLARPAHEHRIASGHDHDGDAANVNLRN